MENEGAREATGQGLADSRTQHDLRHLRNIRKAKALLPGFCFRGNSFTGLSQGKDWKKEPETGGEGARKREEGKEESREVRWGQAREEGKRARGKQTENRKKDERKGKRRGGV